MRCIKCILILVIGSILHMFKKVISCLLFPFVYMLSKITPIYRSQNAYTESQWEIPEILNKNRKLKLFLWMFFDDSIYSDFQENFHPYKHQNKIATFLDKIFNMKFFRSWYWSGFRNSSNNLSHLLAYKLGQLETIEFRCFNDALECRRFTSGKLRPYFELILFNKYVINVGWLSSGKFEGPKIRIIH